MTPLYVAGRERRGGSGVVCRIQTPMNSKPTPILLQDPSFIEAYSPEKILQVVIETPKGSRNKYAFDHERHVIALKKVLPAGMVFPYDFGFVPSTLAEDGDPIDVLLLMDEPAFPGCVLEARLIGVIEGEDELEDGGTQRNDRLLGVAIASHVYGELKTPADLPQSVVDQMQDFFASYPRVLGRKTYKLLGCKGPEEAEALVKDALDRAQKEG